MGSSKQREVCLRHKDIGDKAFLAKKDREAVLQYNVVRDARILITVMSIIIFYFEMF